MRKTLLFVVTVVALLAASTSPAAAVDFGIFGSYWDSDDLGGAFGLGGRIWVDINDDLDFEVSAQWLEEFEDDSSLLEPTPLAAFASVKTKMEAIPVDLGLTYSFGDAGQGFFIGGGGTWAFLDGEIEFPGGPVAAPLSDDTLVLDDIDDEFGWYAKLGYQARGGVFVDLLYRDLSATVAGLTAETLAGTGIPPEIDIDLSGFQVSLGWRF